MGVRPAKEKSKSKKESDIKGQVGGNDGKRVKFQDLQAAGDQVGEGTGLAGSAQIGSSTGGASAGAGED